MTDLTKTIVVVDDSRTFVMYAGMLLKRLGFEVVPAVGADEGLKLIRIFQPHAVLLDRYMPGMDGPEVLKLIKDDPALAEIPVVMVSANDKPAAREECFELGCAGYLAKPLTPFSLQEVLLASLPKQGAHRRRHLRSAYRRKVGIRSDSLTRELYAVSLSEGGVYLRDSQPLAVGARVEVSLPLDGGEVLEMPGQVIYQKDVFQHAFRIEPGMAIAFDAEDRAETQLRRYISGLLAADLVEEQPDPVIGLD